MRRFLICLGLTLASAAQSQPAPSLASTAPEPARLAAAVELMEVMRIRDTLRDRMGPMTKCAFERMIEGITRGPPKMEAERAADPYFDERKRRMTKIASEELSILLAEMMPEMIRSYEVAYARVFTLPELRGQIEFYRSPVGQSVAAKTPEVARIASQTMMPARGPLLAAIGERMKTLQPRIEAALADLPPPPESVN